VRLSDNRHSLKRRIIALSAAYAVALSSLIASFAGAQAAAHIGTQPGFVLCHSESTGTDAPAPSDSDSKLCADCCIGCLMLTAAPPPPPATGVVLERVAITIVHTAAPDVVVPSATTSSNRSRAPPLPL
jgi:hypothetical protein